MIPTWHYLEIWEMFRHEAVNLTDRQASSLAALQGHKDEIAGKRNRSVTCGCINDTVLICEHDRIKKPHCVDGCSDFSVKGQHYRGSRDLFTLIVSIGEYIQGVFV